MTSATKQFIRAATANLTAPATAQPVPTPADVPFTSYPAGSISIPVSEASMANLIVPPGGFYGFANQTPATQQLFARAGRLGGLRSARKRRRKSAAKKKAVRASAKRKTRRSSRKSRLVKGSAAAKRYMARIRKMRKR